MFSWHPSCDTVEAWQSPSTANKKGPSRCCEAYRCFLLQLPDWTHPIQIRPYSPSSNATSLRPPGGKCCEYWQPTTARGYAAMNWHTRLTATCPRSLRH